MNASTAPELTDGGVAADVRAWKSPRAWAVLSAVAALGTWSDLWSKSYAFAHVAEGPVEITREAVLGARHLSLLIPPHVPVVVAPKLLEFTLVLNPGAVFGIGAGQRVFFVLFTGLALVFGLWLFGATTKSKEWVAHGAVGLLLAGGLGNLYDRIIFGCVRDFIHPVPGMVFPFGITTPWSGPEIWPWVSNVADLWLIVGIGVLLIRALGQKPGK
jgi:signal peptidase II